MLPNLLQVIPSRGVKVAGLLGPAAQMEKKSTHIADTPIGLGGTTLWKLAGLVNPLASL
jgi:protein transport protein SEC23